PVRSKRLPASAKQATTSAATSAASRYATGLAGPSRPATVAGSTKIPEPMTPLTAMAVRPGSPKTRISRAGGGLAIALDVVEYRQRGAAEDALLLLVGDRERLDRGDGAIDRSEQVRVVAAHDHVARAQEVARHVQGVGAERHR